MSASPAFKNPRAKHGFQGRTCSIVSVGSYVPARVLTNAELEKLVDTSDEWISPTARAAPSSTTTAMG